MPQHFHFGTHWFCTGTHDSSQDESQDSQQLFVTKSLHKHYDWEVEVLTVTPGRGWTSYSSYFQDRCWDCDSKGQNWVETRTEGHLNPTHVQPYLCIANLAPCTFFPNCRKLYIPQEYRDIIYFTFELHKTLTTSMEPSLCSVVTCSCNADSVKPIFPQ